MACRRVLVQVQEQVLSSMHFVICYQFAHLKSKTMESGPIRDSFLHLFVSHISYISFEIWKNIKQKLPLG